MHLALSTPCPCCLLSPLGPAPFTHASFLPPGSRGLCDTDPHSAWGTAVHTRLVLTHTRHKPAWAGPSQGPCALGQLWRTLGPRPEVPPAPSLGRGPWWGECAGPDATALSSSVQGAAAQGAECAPTSAGRGTVCSQIKPRFQGKEGSVCLGPKVHSFNAKKERGLMGTVGREVGRGGRVPGVQT